MREQTAVTVLVTGVGDTVGQALIKTARHSSIPCNIIGTDRNALSVGLQWVDKDFALPHCSQSEAYLSGMRKICAGEQVHLILPGSESELELLSQNAPALRSETGAIVVASPPEVLRVGMNKWETCRFLDKAGLNFPKFARLTSAEEVERLLAEVGFPLLAKPVRGTGARGLFKIASRQDLDSARESGNELVVQEYLFPDDEEYSIEVYTLKDGSQVGAIGYQRQQLIAGDTYRARITNNEAVQAEARSVAKALAPFGPCNVQLRLTERGPVTFEINPRFSGGVSMRAHFGYNEVEIAIQDLVLDETVPAPEIKLGVALRYWEEMYLDENGAATSAANISAEPGHR